MGDRERKVKDEAYRLWEEAGRPSGRDEELWYEAERRIADAEGAPGGKRGPGTVVKNVGNSGVAAPVSVGKPKSEGASKTAKGKARDAAPGGLNAANDAGASRAGKGEAVDVAPAKGKAPKSARTTDPAPAEKAAKPKADKPKSKAP